MIVCGVCEQERPLSFAHQAKVLRRNYGGAVWDLEDSKMVCADCISALMTRRANMIGKTCEACGGSGLRADELRNGGADLTAEEVEMLDSTRCFTCFGDGVRTEENL